MLVSSDSIIDVQSHLRSSRILAKSSATFSLHGHLTKTQARLHTTANHNSCPRTHAAPRECGKTVREATFPFRLLSEDPSPGSKTKTALSLSPRNSSTMRGRRRRISPRQPPRISAAHNARNACRWSLQGLLCKVGEGPLGSRPSRGASGSCSLQADWWGYPSLPSISALTD